MTFSAESDNNESSISESGDTFFFVLRLNDIVNTMPVNVSLAKARYPATIQSWAIIGPPAKRLLNGASCRAQWTTFRDDNYMHKT